MNEKGQILKSGHQAGLEQRELKSITENMNTVLWTCLMHMDHTHVENLKTAKKMHT